MPVPRGAGRLSRLVARPRAAARRRPVLVASGVAVALLAVAAAGDVALAHTARQRIADAAACRLRPSGPVSARLSGVFAGLRLLTGKVGTIRITAHDVRRSGASLTVTAELHGVTTSGASAGGSATATLSYDELGKRLGRDGMSLRPSGDGHGGLVLTGTVAGIPLPLTVHTRLHASAGELTVTPTDVVVLGADMPLGRLDATTGGRGFAAKLAPRTVTLPRLPGGVRLASATTTANGLLLRLALTPGATSGHHSGCTA